MRCVTLRYESLRFQACHYAPIGRRHEYKIGTRYGITLKILLQGRNKTVRDLVLFTSSPCFPVYIADCARQPSGSYPPEISMKMTRFVTTLCMVVALGAVAFGTSACSDMSGGGASSGSSSSSSGGY